MDFTYFIYPVETRPPSSSEIYTNSLIHSMIQYHNLTALNLLHVILKKDLSTILNSISWI